jgi:ASC-1-like (ASCH) protein
MLFLLVVLTGIAVFLIYFMVEAERLGRVVHRMHCMEPWLKNIESGVKSVEGRVGGYTKYKHTLGRIIELYNDHRVVRARVIAIRHYPNLDSYIDGEGIEKIAPHLAKAGPSNGRSAVKSAYLEIIPAEKIAHEGGVCALQLSLLDI